MRWKIIFVNGGIVLVLAVLTYFLLKTSLENVVANRAEQKRELNRALQAAESQLSLDALRMERWLDRKVEEPRLKGVFAGGTANARSEAATAEANRLRDQIVAVPAFSNMAPSMVLFVDESGVGLGRNGSQLMRGDRVGDAYPSLKDALKAGSTASDVWINPERQEQMLVSYAPLRGDDGDVLGALVVGTPLNDGRLERTSELTSGQSLAFVRTHDGAASTVAATGNGVSGTKNAAVQKGAIQAVSSSNLTQVPQVIDGRWYGAIRLGGYGDSSAAIVGSVPASRVDSIRSLLWPVFAVAGLGLFLVAVGGVMLGNYISRPVADMEEGLLLIMNGHQDLRIELAHDELGGLASRINALLNTLLGVPEDNTDEHGRPSTAPSGSDFNEALAVDETSVSAPEPEVDVQVARVLAALSADEYYANLYGDYIAAKRKLGDPVDHITQDAFRTRIVRSEQEMLVKYGRPVRYRAELKGAGVVLVAVPLVDATG